MIRYSDVRFLVTNFEGQWTIILILGEVMNAYKNRKLFAVVCFLATITWANSASALPIISGNSYIPDLSFDSADEIGYAAYDRNGGTSSDPWNTGINNIAGVFSGALDTSANYLYLYQIINSTRGPVIEQANIPTSPFPNAVTSYGAFTGLSFVSGNGTSSGISVSNPPIITDTTGQVGNPNYPYPGILIVPFFNPAVSLTNATLSAVIGDVNVNNDVAGDSVSYIFGYTSNAAPFSVGVTGLSSQATVNYTPYTDNMGIFHDGTAFAPGVATITRHVPEPETFALILLGLFGIAVNLKRGS